MADDQGAGQSQKVAVRARRGTDGCDQHVGGAANPGIEGYAQEVKCRLGVVALAVFLEIAEAPYQDHGRSISDSLAISRPLDQGRLDGGGPGIGPGLQQDIGAKAMHPVGTFDTFSEGWRDQPHRVQKLAGLTMAGLTVDIELAGLGHGVFERQAVGSGFAPGPLDQGRQPAAGR